MGLLDRAVDRLKAEEAQTKPGPVPSRPLAKPKRGESEELAFDSSADIERRPADLSRDLSADLSARRPNRTSAASAFEVPDSRTFDDWSAADQPQGLRVSGDRVAIDLPALAKMGFAVPGFPQDSGMLDEHRRIKRALLFNAAIEQLDDAPSMHSNLVLVSSAVAGEGKTFVSTNLALVLSLEVDRQTLLIDADVIRRGASHLLGLDQMPGLIDYLAGDVDDFNDLLLRPVGIDNLQILPAGTPHENVNELLASERMKDLVEELSVADRDRLVVIDSPPLLMTSETSLLTQYAGQIALVVRADSTPRYTVDQALASIPPERFAGLILNDAARNRSVDGYSDYYEE